MFALFIRKGPLRAYIRKLATALAHLFINGFLALFQWGSRKNQMH